MTTGHQDSKIATDGHIAYGLYALTIVTGVTAIAGLIFCYLKRGDYDDDLWSGHMTWLIRTFWISVAAFFVSIALTVILIGGLTMLATGVWFIYRVIKGWIYWNDGKALEDPDGLF